MRGHRPLRDKLVCTNALYPLVALVYARKGYYFQAVALAASAAASAAYHRSAETACGALDQGAAVTSLLATAAVLPRLPRESLAAALGALVVALVAKYAWQPEDVRDPGYACPHCAWHLAIAACAR